MKKFISRKLIVAVMGIIFLVLRKQFGLEIDDATAEQITNIVIFFIVGQGVVDVAAVVKEKK